MMGRTGKWWRLAVNIQLMLEAEAFVVLPRLRGPTGGTTSGNQCHIGRQRVRGSRTVTTDDWVVDAETCSILLRQTFDKEGYHLTEKSPREIAGAAAATPVVPAWQTGMKLAKGAPGQS